MVLRINQGTHWLRIDLLLFSKTVHAAYLTATMCWCVVSLPL